MGEGYSKHPSSGPVSRAATKRRVELFRGDPLEQTNFLDTLQPSWDAEQYDEAEGLPEDDEEAWLEFDAEFVEPEASPNGANAPFAPLLSGAGHWPIITSDPQGRTVSYRTVAGAWMGRQGRSFGANRSSGTRYHIGIDLFGRFGDSVVAIEDGRIVRFFPFCCGDNKTSWALLVRHANVVVNYGEVAPDSLSRNSLAIGSNVRAGQVIGRVGRNPGGSTMIHFETYTTGTTRSYRWMKGRTRPARLLNPTRLLLELQEHGLPRPVGGGAVAPVPTPAQGTRGTVVHSCRPGEGPPAAEPDPQGRGLHPSVYRGTGRRVSRNPGVGDAQALLNRFLIGLTSGTFRCHTGADMAAIQGIRGTLTQDPLSVDCRFGLNTEKATRMFQRCVFPGQPGEWDGKIGPTTWRELERLRTQPGVPSAPVSPTTGGATPTPAKGLYSKGGTEYSEGNGWYNDDEFTPHLG